MDILHSVRDLCRTRCNVVILSAVLLHAPQMLFADNSRVSVSSETWARIGTTTEFMEIAGLQKLVEEMNNNAEAVLEIHFAGGETGQLWAQQFRNRLIALGIESSRIILAQGGTTKDRLQIDSRNSR